MNYLTDAAMVRDISIRLLEALSLRGFQLPMWRGPRKGTMPVKLNDVRQASVRWPTSNPISVEEAAEILEKHVNKQNLDWIHDHIAEHEDLGIFFINMGNPYIPTSYIVTDEATGLSVRVILLISPDSAEQYIQADIAWTLAKNERETE